MNIQFRVWNCDIRFDSYIATSSPAIYLVDAADGEHIAVATTNVPDLAIDEVAIKNYSENAGMYDTLLLAGLITPAHRVVDSGFVSIPICYLTEKAQAIRVSQMEE